MTSLGCSDERKYGMKESTTEARCLPLKLSFQAEKRLSVCMCGVGEWDSKASSLHKVLSHVLLLWKIRLEALEVSPQTAPPLPAALIFSRCNNSHSLLLVWVQHTLLAVLNASLLQ